MSGLRAQALERFQGSGLWKALRLQKLHGVIELRVGIATTTKTYCEDLYLFSLL